MHIPFAILAGARLQSARLGLVSLSLSLCAFRTVAGKANRYFYLVVEPYDYHRPL